MTDTEHQQCGTSAVEVYNTAATSIGLMLVGCLLQDQPNCQKGKETVAVLTSAAGPEAAEQRPSRSCHRAEGG